VILRTSSLMVSNLSKLVKQNSPVGGHVKLHLLLALLSSRHCRTYSIQVRGTGTYRGPEKPWKCSLNKSRNTNSASLPVRYVEIRNQERTKPRCTGYPRFSWLENHKKTRRAWTRSCIVFRADERREQSVTSNPHDSNGRLGKGSCGAGT